MAILEPHPDGMVLRVRATPGAKRAGVGGQHDGMLKVSVTDPPDKGKANKAIIELLAETLGVSKSQIVLLAAETACHKRFLISGISDQETAAIQAVIDGLAHRAGAS